MYNFKLFEILEGIEQLDCESPDEIMVKAIKVIYLEKLKKVHAQQLERHAQMLPENHIIVDMDHVHDIVLVVLP